MPVDNEAAARWQERSTLARMAGNIASGMWTNMNVNPDASDDIARIARASVATARAILAELDKEP